MRTLQEALNQFAYHPATPETAKQHSRVRDVFQETAAHLWAVTPDGPEKTLALRKLQEAQMYANLAVALQAPADTGETRGVARTLPLAAPQVDLETVTKPTAPDTAVAGQSASGAGPFIRSTKCQCDGTVMTPGEPFYDEGGKRHYAKSSTTAGFDCFYL